MRRPRSFRQQIVVLTASVTALAMLLLSLVLQIVLARVTNNDADRVLQDRAEAVIGSIRADTSGGTLTVPDSLLDAGVAVYDGNGVLVIGSTPRSLAEYYEDLAETTTTVVKDAQGRSRVRAEPFTTSGGARGVVIVTERLDPYEEAESLALIVSLVTGLVTTAAAAAIAAWTTRRALRPVAEMAQTATDWSEHDLGRRFALGPPSNEISALAGTLDTLLDKVSSAIRSEQRLTSELAHELRTPLTTIQGTAELMLLRHRDTLSGPARDDLLEISAAGQRMATTITTLLELARNESTVLAAAHCRLTDVLDEVVRDRPPVDAALEVAVDDVLLALPLALAVRTVTPVVENALRFADTRVRVSSSVSAGTLELRVEDDGGGVDAAVLDVLFEPGVTSDAHSGSGLGLAIARRIARTAGGDVILEPTEPGTPGARFVIRLPIA